ncbi:hypothetical protein GE061_006672 [Apolygus lucorum]|uniref:Uncharacterized protein n=1 Tax=Apolygus lucorum TaxID=248454 RepID=A0A6A4JCV5_APOLU|nr:hypothetical protein GE061_006672 [Apolygus lucorum]
MVLFAYFGTVSSILPNYGDSPSFENDIGDSLNFDLFKPRKIEKLNFKRSKSNETISSIDELSRKLHSKITSTIDRSGSVPARSIKDLEELMSHPTWLTDSTKKKISEPLSDRNRRIFVAPAASEGQWYPKVDDDQRQHIKEIITKFQTLKPKPITDNRITKFVFTNDGDLATSKTVQEHNKEVAAAFMDFNKKLEETLNIKGGKKIVGVGRSDTSKDANKDGADNSFNKVFSFLEKNIHKLKEEVPHKQVCRKHKSHSKDEDDDFKEVDANRVNFGGIKRFNELAQTRDGLENILLGLDRPRRGPFRRQIVRKFNKAPAEFSDKG